MRPLTRLGLYAVILLAVFGLSFAAGSVLVPQRLVDDWTPDPDHGDGERRNDHGGQRGGGHDGEQYAHAGGSLGLTMEDQGHRLADVSAPVSSGQRGTLALRILDPDGRDLTDIAISHEQELHLIVVRTDGSHFAHVHPERDAAGTWTIPWRWEAAGTYRIFADFVPADLGHALTLSTLVNVPGEVRDGVEHHQSTTTQVEGFDVALSGDLAAGESASLEVTVTRGGEPVAVEPYLGAAGHLVVLRSGDLAYLHAHPDGEDLAFHVTVPTPGVYLLYLDFQVDGQVHTAHLVLQTEESHGDH